MSGTVEGGRTRDVFPPFMRAHLVPGLRSGDVMEMDHLGAHHARNVRRGIETAGATVLFTPAYLRTGTRSRLGPPGPAPHQRQGGPARLGWPGPTRVARPD